MRPFSYHRPATVAEAVALLRAAPNGRFLSGGMTLIPALKQRLAAPSDLIDLAAIDGLAAIRIDGDRLVVGAMASHDAVATSAIVRAAIPGLADLARGIGDPQVRNRGTLGGAIANNDPAADYPAAVLALGATIETDRRRIAADGFFTGLFETALEADEPVVAVRFPIPRRAAYAKFRQRGSGYAVAGVMVAATAGGVRLAVTGAGPCVFRVPAMEAALTERFHPDGLAGCAIAADGLNADLHAAADYRAHLVSVMAGRAVAAAC
ncbi:MAG: FAD binding domain-containing protein [Rhodospirillales bacterium]